MEGAAIKVHASTSTILNYYLILDAVWDIHAFDTRPRDRTFDSHTQISHRSYLEIRVQVVQNARPVVYTRSVLLICDLSDCRNEIEPKYHDIAFNCSVYKLRLFRSVFWTYSKSEFGPRDHTINHQELRSDADWRVVCPLDPLNSKIVEHE